MEGISVVYLALQEIKEETLVVIANLDEVKQKIIPYFGNYALEIYGLTGIKFNH